MIDLNKHFTTVPFPLALTVEEWEEWLAYDDCSLNAATLQIGEQQHVVCLQHESDDVKVLLSECLEYMKVDRALMEAISAANEGEISEEEIADAEEFANISA